MVDLHHLRRADDVIADDPRLTGAYHCLTIAEAPDVRPRLAAALARLEAELGLGNEFTGTRRHPRAESCLAV